MSQSTPRDKTKSEKKQQNTHEKSKQSHVKEKKPWKRNNHCLTLELKPDSQYRDKMRVIKNGKYGNRHESTFIQTRRDRSQFLLYCCNCLNPGHTSTKCNERYKICVIGDSHTAVWARANHLYINCHIVRCRIAGMSAQGLTNQESQLQSAKRICQTLNKCHSGKTQYIFIQIGQVDVDFVWYFRKINFLINQQNEKNNTNEMKNEKEEAPSFEDQIEKSTNKLFDFLENILLKQDLPLLNDNFDSNNEKKENEDNNRKKGIRSKIIIHGIHLPPLNTKQMKIVLKRHFVERSKMDSDLIESFFTENENGNGNGNDKDSDIGIIPNHQERTKMAFQFNQVVKEKACKFGYQYVDICHEIYDKARGTVGHEFIKTECQTDIHLNPDKLLPIYHFKFKQMNLPFAVQIENHAKSLDKFEMQLQQRFQY